MYTVGTDPECFFHDPKMMVLPAKVVFDEWGLPDKFPVEDHGYLYVDGASLEFQPSAGSPEEVVNNLRELLRRSLELSPNISIVPQLGIDLEWAKRDRRIAVFGCDPDLSAWGEGCAPACIDAAVHPWRYAGAHIHLGRIGSPNYFKNRIINVSKILDRTIGLASMVVANNTDNLRRHVYGRPGIYRHQPWGMEYRTPSNNIIQSPIIAEYMFGLAIETVKLQKHYEMFRELIPDELLLTTLRGDDIGQANDLYSIVREVFGFGEIPQITTGWKEAWEVQ